MAREWFGLVAVYVGRRQIFYVSYNGVHYLFLEIISFIGDHSPHYIGSFFCLSSYDLLSLFMMVWLKVSLVLKNTS